jgi:anion-transporting  ArsA/GET3 family ATPase
LLAAVADKRVTVIMGKGGVGRTTVAAALASRLAAEGKKTLLFQAGAKDKLARLYGIPPVGTEITALPPADGKLWAVNTNPAAAVAEYGHMVLKFDTVYRLVMENQVIKKLLRAIPGIDDYSIIGKLWFHTTELEGGRPRWDHIVFDAPATGHALNMFRIPRAILAAVPEGPLTKSAQEARVLYEDPGKTTAVLVTLPEELPVSECAELAARLPVETGMHASHLVVNQLASDRFFLPGPPARVLAELVGAGAEADPTLGPMVSAARRQRARRQRQERYLARLAELVPLPQSRLPHLPPHADTIELGQSELSVLGARL